MRKFKTTVAAAALLLFGAAGCADLEVVNPNDPDREQALASANDVESLIAGAYNTWYLGLYYYQTFWMSNASFQSSATAANFGNIDQGPIPRVPIINDNAYADYHYTVERVWQRTYRALAAVADGIRTLDNNAEMGATLDANEAGAERRVRAIGKTTQALGHATLALWYDQGFIVDESTDLTQDQEPVSSEELMAAAYGYFEEAISLAEGQSWTIPSQWMAADVSASQLVRLLHSWRAIHRASFPRTESDPVDWNAVLSDINNGITETYVMDNGSGWYNGSFDINGGPNGWGAESYFIIGMADQSGDYQRWLADPVDDRLPWFGANQDDDPFLIITPDQRFPQGSTIAEQEANPGAYYHIPRANTFNYDVADHFTNPSRGTWRWSYYYNPKAWEYWFVIDDFVPHITIEEMNLLRAEALLETGDAAGAAALINQTRTAYGLNATDAAGTNTSCVPKLPSGACGDLWEMMKWEKRMETKIVGLAGISWYWDGRRWGDLYEGTPLQFPIPAGELQTLQMEVYTLGGVDDVEPNASEGSNYQFPHEGS